MKQNNIKLQAVKSIMEQIGKNSRQDYVFEKLDQAIKNNDIQMIWEWEQEASPRNTLEQMMLDTALEILNKHYADNVEDRNDDSGLTEGDNYDDRE
jgi:hypothetical protein